MKTLQMFEKDRMLSTCLSSILFSAFIFVVCLSDPKLRCTAEELLDFDFVNVKNNSLASSAKSENNLNFRSEDISDTAKEKKTK